MENDVSKIFYFSSENYNWIFLSMNRQLSVDYEDPIDASQVIKILDISGF